MDNEYLPPYRISNLYLQAAHLNPQHFGFRSIQNLNLELRDPRTVDLDDAEKNAVVGSGGVGEEKPVKQERKITGWRWPVLVISVISAVFLYCLDTNLTSILIPVGLDQNPSATLNIPISYFIFAMPQPSHNQQVLLAEFGSASKLPWIFVGFSLGAITLVLPVGKLYTLFPAKQLYITFLVLFTVGSGLCGAAQSMDMLIIGRVVAGAGGIGLYTGIIVILSSITTADERPAYVGLV
ncbi:hypothetical protein IFR05_006712, partial [Cadophora sp. M221]